MRKLVLILALLQLDMSPSKGVVTRQETRIVEAVHFDIEKTDLRVYMGGEVLVTIHPDKTITYGPKYTPDAAAKALWKAVADGRPCNK